MKHIGFLYVLTLILFAGCNGCADSPVREPVVTISGFVIDSTLDRTIFTERDKVENEFPDRGGYARIARYWEKDGSRSYLMHPPYRKYGMSRKEHEEILASMRDTVMIMNHFWDSSFYESEDLTGYFKHNLKRIYFVYDYHVGVGCEVKITFDTIPSWTKNTADTLTVRGEVSVYNFSDIASHNNSYIPDSVYLSFNRVPGSGSDTLIGRLYASIKDFTDHWGDVFFEGEFMIDMGFDILWE